MMKNPVKTKRIKRGFQMMVQMVRRMLTQIVTFSTKSTNSLVFSKKKKTSLQPLQTHMGCN